MVYVGLFMAKVGRCLRPFLGRLLASDFERQMALSVFFLQFVPFSSECSLDPILLSEWYPLGVVMRFFDLNGKKKKKEKC